MFSYEINVLLKKMQVLLYQILYIHYRKILMMYEMYKEKIDREVRGRRTW
jgi:hypothetical protein